jgi:FtsZ-interacting cell division protein ZipA
MHGIREWLSVLGSVASVIAAVVAVIGLWPSRKSKNRS